MILYQCDLCGKVTNDTDLIHKFEYRSPRESLTWTGKKKDSEDFTLRSVPDFKIYTCKRCAVKLLKPIYGDEIEKAIEEVTEDESV